MDQHDIDRIRRLAKDARSDPRKAAELRRRLKKRLDRLKAERPR
jgi:hypothetical protein